MDQNQYSGRSGQGLAGSVYVYVYILYVRVLREGCGDGADREQREKGGGPMATAAIVPF